LDISTTLPIRLLRGATMRWRAKLLHSNGYGRGHQPGQRSQHEVYWPSWFLAPLLRQLGLSLEKTFQWASNSIHIQLFFRIWSGPHEHEINELGPRQFDCVHPTDQGIKSRFD
jgi:hypothetical protein